MFDFKEKMTEGLIKAIRQENYKKAKFYIKLGADVNKDNQPLKIAVAKSKADITKLLLDSGADPNINDNELLNWACIDGNAEIVKLLIAAGVDVRYNDNVSMQYAASEGRIEVMKLLLEAGADPVQ